MRFLLYFSSYVTMNTILAALDLMNVISYLLCIDSSVDSGKDSTECIFFLDIILEMEKISKKKKRKDEIFFQCPNIYISNSISFIVGLLQSVLKKKKIIQLIVSPLSS